MPSKQSITYITAGAAGMYCGSCMHDNTLARALNQIGWETLLVPTYTPIRTDESDVTIDTVFFGGINVFLQQKIPLFRLIPRMLDRFLDRPWLIKKMTQRAIETDAKLLGALTVSMLKGNKGNQRKEVNRIVDWLSDTVQPSALILSNVLVAGFVEQLKHKLQIPVIVTLQGDDIFLESLQEPHKSQAIRLIESLDAHIDGYLVHSQYYADFMSEYLGLDRQKMHITPLGIDVTDFEGATGVRNTGPPTIGYLARLTADKGLHLLVDAFIELKRDPLMEKARLLIAGWLGADHHDYADLQFKKLRDAGLAESFEYLGSVNRSDKLQMLKQIDVLSVPTTYHEPKGLYVLEALAAGVPVVQPAHGVFPELIEQTGGGRLYDPHQLTELSAELKRLLLDPDLRRYLGDAGQKAVFQTRDARHMAEATAAVVSNLVG